MKLATLTAMMMMLVGCCQCPHGGVAQRGPVAYEHSIKSTGGLSDPRGFSYQGYWNNELWQCGMVDFEYGKWKAWANEEDWTRHSFQSEMEARKWLEGTWCHP